VKYFENLSTGLRVIGKKPKFLFGVLWNFGVPYWMYLAAGRGRGCAPLLTTKYEVDVVKTDRDIEVSK